MTSDDMEKYRLLAAAKRRRESRAWLRRWSAVTWEQYEEFVDVYVDPDSKSHDLLLAYSETEPLKGAARPCMVKDLKRILRTEVSRTFRDLDRLSFVGSLDVGTDEDLQLYKHYNPTMISGMLREGTVVQITGLPRTGKTNFALQVAEQWLKENPTGRLLTNVWLDFPEAPPWYRYVTTARQLFAAIADCLEAKVDFIWLLDEGGLVVQHIEEITRRARGLGRILRTTGKDRGRFIFIEQRADAVPSTIQEFSRLLIVCESQESHDVVSVEHVDKDGNHIWGIHVRGFPKTTLPYDTRDKAAFNLDDLDLLSEKSVFAALAGATDQPKAIREYLERPPELKSVEREAPSWHAIVDANEGLTNSDAAAKAGVSESSVATYRRQKRNREQQQQDR